jgi:hypothetical protein
MDLKIMCRHVRDNRLLKQVQSLISVGCTTPTIGSHNDTPSSDCYHITVLLLPQPPVKTHCHYVLEAIMKQFHGTLMVRVARVTGMLHDPR